MQQMLEKIFRCHGSTITVNRGAESWALQGFLQPVNSTAKQNMLAEASPLGTVPTGQYVFIGPAAPEILAGDMLTAQGEVYLLRRAEILWQGDTPLYQWGLCTKKGGVDTWPNLS